VKEDKVLSLEGPAEVDAQSPLEQLIAAGARQMLQAAIEQEVEEYLQAHRGRQSAEGRAIVVRNGHLPERQLITGVGPIPVHQPRVRHRDGQHFSSAILPKYLRRVPSIDALIPALYLKGVSTRPLARVANCTRYARFKTAFLRHAPLPSLVWTAI
jgi:putative transposase